MKCPECGKEMREGYLFCSKDGAFSFANEVPGVFENAKKRRWLCEDHRPQGKPPDESSSLHLRGMQDGHAQVLIEVSATAHIQPEKAPKPLCQNGLGGLLCWEWKPLAKGFMEVSGVLHQAIRAIWQHCCLLLTRSIRQALQNLSNICIHTDRLPLDLLRANRLSLVDTGVDCVRVLRRHLPEGVLDDDWGVVAYA